MASLRIKPPLLFTAATILPPLCTVVVVGRFVARKVQKLRFGADDWLVIPALITVYGMGLTIIIGTAQKALGYPTPKVPPDQVLTAASWQQVAVEKCYVAMTLLQTASLTFTKLSVMQFYNRIFGVARKPVRWVVYIANAIIIAWGSIYFFVFLFTCGTDFGHLWSSTADALTCPLELPKIDISLSITDVIMDVFILLFPIPLILPLQMSAIRKVAILGIFVLGASAIGTSITRLVILKEELSVYVQTSADEDFVATDILYFMHVEASIALIAINLPSIAGFMKLQSVQRALAGMKSLLSSAPTSHRGDAQVEDSWNDGKKPRISTSNDPQDPSYESYIEAQPYSERGSIPATGITVVSTFSNSVDKQTSHSKDSCSDSGHFIETAAFD